MRMFKLISASALALSLAACGGTTGRGLESEHQPVVSRTNYVYDVASRVSGDEANGLVRWLESLRVGYGDRISVDDPEGDSGAREEVAAIVARYGLLVDDVAPITQGEVGPGMVRVVISRSRAEVPGCPDWSAGNSEGFSSRANSNFGCAANSNLAAMVANPEDLIQGQAKGGVNDAYTSMKAIRTYRAAPPSGTQGITKTKTKGGE